LEVLRREAGDPQSSWRGEAGRKLAELLGKDALPAILLLSKDNDPAIRESAAQGLAVIPEPASSERLCRLLEDQAGFVRAAACDGVARHRYQPAMPGLLRIAEQDHDDSARTNAVRALDAFNDKRAVPVLLTLVEADVGIGFFAALTLGRIGDETAIPILAAAFQRNKIEAFAIAIARIDGPDAAFALRRLLPGSATDDRINLVSALQEMRHVAAIPALLLGSADDESAVRTVALAGLASVPRTALKEGLRLAMADGDPVIRTKAADISPFYAEGPLLDALESLVSDSNRGVATAAAEALAKLKFSALLKAKQ